METNTINESNSNSQKAKKTKGVINYKGFYLINEYATAGIENQLLSSSIVNNHEEIIMSSSERIEVIDLKYSRYLINSTEQTLIVEVAGNELEVLVSVSRTAPSDMYKVTDFLKNNKLVILTDYNQDEKRHFEYLYDYISGKRISSGFDSIDEVNGKLKVTYGLATGDLDLDGTFIMEPDKQNIRTKGIFERLFYKGRC